jgi:hypothetical protein
MFEAIFASVAGSAVSSLLGGGSRSQTLPAKFNRRPAPFRRRVENVMEPDTQGFGKNYQKNPLPLVQFKRLSSVTRRCLMLLTLMLVRRGLYNPVVSVDIITKVSYATQ